MNYLIKRSFATLKRVYSQGEIVADVEDADNLVAAELIEAVKEEQPEPDEVSTAKPVTKKRSAK